MIAPARVAAYEILSAVEAGRADLSDALAATRGTLHDDDRDKALAAEIAIGVQRWRAALDHLIAHFAKRPLQRLDREVLEILRLSAYQLLHLTRVPAAAVVDDAVDLTGRMGKRSASGLVNAVLRAISRHSHALPLPPSPRTRTIGRPRSSTSQRHAVAPVVARGSLGTIAFGFDATETWLRFNNAPAPLTLRANRLRNTPQELIERLRQDEVVVHRARFAPDALIVAEGHPLRGDGLDAGWFVVQDEASQLVTLLAGADPGARVLDTCASPGGKATALAASMRGGGFWWRATSAIGAWTCCDGRSPRAAPRTFASLRPICSGRCLSLARSTACSSTRRVPVSARCGAIRTSSGAGKKATCPRLPRPRPRCFATPPPRSCQVDG